MMKLFFGSLFIIAPLAAAEFKSDKECVVGSKVEDRENLTGTIVTVERGTCRVKLDQGGKVVPYQFWMLHAAGGSRETDDKLVVGKYDCWVGGSGAGTLTINSMTSYESEGKSGKFHVEATTRKIVFETGPFSRYHAKLLNGPKIGLNLNGGSFYNMTCDPQKK
jgi:hypothetical protein